MAMVIKICQASLPGRWLLIISAPSIERPPAADSRGSVAATRPSGVTGECGCHSHVHMMVAMRGVDLSGLGGMRKL